MLNVYQCEQLVRRSRSEVFEFFSRAENLERITPPSLRFRILTPQPIEMRSGTLIDYELRLWGVPFRWRTLIESYEPESSFVDVQLKGPYRVWRHTHTFSDHTDGTLIRDRVEYELPFGVLGELPHRLFVRRQVEQIFRHRRAVIDELFPS
jgi:ligand-binding SRPBCC domain-containing protein